METMFDFLKAHYQFVLIGFGLFVVVGSILKWRWLLVPSGKMKNSFIYSTIIDKYGTNGMIGINIFFGILFLVFK